MTRERGRTQINRKPDRGVDDRSVLYALLDEVRFCHVGFVVDDSPRMIATLHARHGDRLLVHGSPAAGFINAVRKGNELCVAVTSLDGLVLARSAFNHSANYRSAVIFGVGRRLTDPDEKRVALDAFVDRVAPGRRETLRPMTDLEVRKTDIAEIPLDEWSLKTRSGPPTDDDPEDYEHPIWAGVVPMTVTYDAPHPAPDNHPDADWHEHLDHFKDFSDLE